MMPDYEKRFYEWCLLDSFNMTINWIKYLAVLAAISFLLISW